MPALISLESGALWAVGGRVVIGTQLRKPYLVPGVNKSTDAVDNKFGSSTQSKDTTVSCENLLSNIVNRIYIAAFARVIQLRDRIFGG